MTVKIRDIIGPLGLQSLGGGDDFDVEVMGGYCSDLLSDVMANAKEGDVWITLHTHLNIVAVGMLAKVAAVVVTGGRLPEQAVIDRASQEGLALFSSKMTTFEVAGRLHRILKP